MKFDLDWERVDRIIDSALSEDVGPGDITTNALADKGIMCEATIQAKEDGVIAGLPAAGRVFRRLDPGLIFKELVSDGETAAAGTVIAEISGTVRAVLTCERLALNMLQRMSGIATATRSYVDAVSGTGAKILDTRKTVPGLRLLDKYAVNAGGGTNHRMGLYDNILIKDNHIKLAGGIGRAVESVRDIYGGKYSIEVETETLGQVREALSAQADIIMLDNMSLEEMGQAVHIINKRALTEASGGIKLENIREIAETGVDFISVGALTHSVMALDIGLDIRYIKNEVNKLKVR